MCWCWTLNVERKSELGVRRKKSRDYTRKIETPVTCGKYFCLGQTCWDIVRRRLSRTPVSSLNELTLHGHLLFSRLYFKKRCRDAVDHAQQQQRVHHHSRPCAARAGTALPFERPHLLTIISHCSAATNSGLRGTDPRCFISSEVQ